MFLKIPRSYIVSDLALNFLSDCGFHLIYPKSHQEDGTKKALIPLKDKSGNPYALEFCEIVDEVLFVAKEPYGRQLQHSQSPLAAHWSEIPQEEIHADSHPNTVYAFAGPLLLEDLDQEPWAEYLQIRKNFSLAAVHLYCEDLGACEKFRNFDREYLLGGRRFGLIHLGPSSFDLLIEQVSGSAINNLVKV